ncbi:DUF6262 family protein [Nonomuraea wenchangensis]|uniref:DUF6262 family protein n=1 Tax=Nonomuraea wenchangensis TaxID=568860 RepID=UPI0037B079A5
MSGDSAMAAGRRADSARRRQRVLAVLKQARQTGEDLSVSAVARRAGVDRTFLYRHRDLLEQVHLAASQPAAGDDPPSVSRASLQADLANAQERNGRSETRIRQLEKKLSEFIGEQAWRESGMGAPHEVDTLTRRVTELEQTVVDLQTQLQDRSEELAAARAANRELMTRLNASR